MWATQITRILTNDSPVINTGLLEATTLTCTERGFQPLFKQIWLLIIDSVVQ